MSEDYNYRHLFSQSDRNKLLYGWSCLFPRSAWDRQEGWRVQGDFPSDGNDPEVTRQNIESYTIKEGVDFVDPHPSRVAWDCSAPLANINTGNGPQWITYWDIVRYSSIQHPDYYNLSEVSSSSDAAELIQSNSWYFNFYFDPKILTLPPCDTSVIDANDRTTSIGMYSGKNGDNGCFLYQFFWLMNPKVEGICEYDCDIWMRYTVAGNGTIIHAEPMPSLPCAYGGINQNDNRNESASFAMDLLPHQDALSNLSIQLNDQIRLSLVQLWMIDQDSLDDDAKKYIKDALDSKSFFQRAHLILYSATKLRELGVQDPRQAFAIIQANLTQTIETLFNAINRLLSFCDRLMNISRNEVGESNPREISATEAQMINTTTQTIHTFVGNGIDEQRAAVKRILYESRVSFGSANISAPVLNRYTVDTIVRAGFKTDASVKDGDLVPAHSLVYGPTRKIIYSYFFDSRDGADRASNPQSAQVLTQLAQTLMSIPIVAQKMGLRRIFSLFNHIIRLSGAGWDLKLEVDPNEDEKITPEGADEVMARIERLEKAVEALLNQVPVPSGGPQGAPAGGPPQQISEQAALMEPVAG